MDGEAAIMMGETWEALEMLRRCDAFAALIPEVRSNLAYARKGARTPTEVLAVEGRITQSAGKVIIPAGLAFGASDHLARFLIKIGESHPEIRAALNFAYNPELRPFLKEFARMKGWEHIEIDRAKEPEELRSGERRSVPWKAEEVMRGSKGRMPRLASESGAVGKEPVSVILGADPVEVVREMCELAEGYAEWARPRERVGKLDNELLERAVLRWQGARSDEVIVPPMVGVDAAVVKAGDGRVLIIAEDPVFTAPGLPLEVFGWAVVHIGASDVAVMGVAPQFMTYSLLLPPGTDESTISTIARSVSEAAKELGISIVGGHTGIYPGISAPMVGGVTVFAFAEDASYVTPACARPGDDLILTKGAAVETAAALSMAAKGSTLRDCPASLVDQACDRWREMTVVKDALVAKRSGEVHAMHDATEGGVLGGIWEMAECSGVGVEVDEMRIILPPTSEMVCDRFSIDPLRCISEGSLLIACAPSSSERIVEGLEREGIPASVIGQFVQERGTRRVLRRGGFLEDIGPPREDPFWGKLINTVKLSQ